MKKLLLAALLLVGCTDVNQIADTSVFYKRDVRIKFEGKEYLGVAVLPARDKYDLELTFAGTVDLFTFKTCHRHITQEDAGGGRIWDKKNKVSFTYRPEPSIESNDYCLAEIEGHEKEKGRHSWALIDFQTPLESLPAVTVCNGTRQGYDGVSVCQSLSGLLQRIIFTKKVSVVSPEGCPNPLTTNGEVFDIIVPTGRCVYSFRAVGEPRDYHRLTTLGYQEIMVRNMQ